MNNDFSLNFSSSAYFRYTSIANFDERGKQDFGIPFYNSSTIEIMNCLFAEMCVQES